jgi:hypothetical protein
VAQKVEVTLVDDLDGSPAVETVSFGLDGRHYEIDLSAANAKQLRKQMKAYINKKRTVAPPAPRQEAAAIRQWAKANGYEVAARGRIHRDVVQAYRNASAQ